MNVDILCRRWGGPDGGWNGMAVAVAYFAFVLAEMGHTVRGYAMPSYGPTWTHPRIEWHGKHDLSRSDSWPDLTITTVSYLWPQTVRSALAAGARDRLVYWHHHPVMPPGQGALLASPPAVEPTNGWARHVILPPSSWAADSPGECTGDAVFVSSASPAKGGPLACEIARLCPDLRWYVLPGRASPDHLAAWRALPHVELAAGPLPHLALLDRARVVLSPTRSEVHPLLLVEAAVRGVPIVCTDLPGCRAAASAASFVQRDAPAEVWAAALREALARPQERLVLPPYREVVERALGELRPAGAAEACA